MARCAPIIASILALTVFAAIPQIAAAATPHTHVALGMTFLLGDWVSNIQSFETQIITASAAVVVIGVVIAMVGWFTRSQEGLAPIFWTGLGCVIVGSIILGAAAFVGGLS